MSDKKTVKDAYEFYNGEYPKSTESRVEGWHAGLCGGVGIADVEFLVFKGEIACTRQEFEDYARMMELNKLNKEAVKPVYTQEMADNGELPPVGFGCMIEFNENKWQEFKLIAETELSLFCCVNDKEMVIPKDARLSFKLFDTRTDEEKLIDELADKLSLTAQDDKAKLKSALSEYKITKE